MLGRYVLVVIGVGWQMLRSLRGVSGVLLEPEAREMVDGEFRGEIPESSKMVPALVDERVVERIRSECVNNIWVNPESKPVSGRSFVYGQKVFAVKGPFAGHSGTYDSKARKGRDAALFTLFGREQRILFNSGELTAV